MQWTFFLGGAALAAVATALLTLGRARYALRRARRLTDELRNKEHLLELAQLTGGLAHEIKNPLSTIKLNLKLLAEEFPDRDDDLHRRNANRLQRLQDEVQRLHNILAEFLQYAGNVELHAAEVDMRDIVEELVDFFRPQAESHGVVLRPALPESPVPCRLDSGLMKQAILNLLINANQAMPQGGEMLLRLTADPDRALLEIIDTGPGIEPGDRRRIFETYYSTRPGGSGLGLPTTRRIIDRHNGSITVDGEPGKGTRFVIALPLSRPQ